jgi:hypothetical protein
MQGLKEPGKARASVFYSRYFVNLPLFRENPEIANEQQPNNADDDLRSCFKNLQLAQYGVKNRLKMLIYSHVNGASSPIFALSCTQPSNFKTASKMEKLLEYPYNTPH